MISLWWLKTMLIVGGLGQIALIIGSLAIPKELGWREELAPLQPLTRQMFWVYAGYIWGTNLSFGLISALAPMELLAGTTLSAAVTGFIFVYWAARMILQFAYFDLSALPIEGWQRWAKGVLDVLFVCLTLLYGAIFVMHLTHTLPKG